MEYILTFLVPKWYISLESKKVHFLLHQLMRNISYWFHFCYVSYTSYWEEGEKKGAFEGSNEKYFETRNWKMEREKVGSFHQLNSNLYFFHISFIKSLKHGSCIYNISMEIIQPMATLEWYWYHNGPWHVNTKIKKQRKRYNKGREAWPSA